MSEWCLSDRFTLFCFFTWMLIFIKTVISLIFKCTQLFVFLNPREPWCQLDGTRCDWSELVLTGLNSPPSSGPCSSVWCQRSSGCLSLCRPDGNSDRTSRCMNAQTNTHTQTQLRPEVGDSCHMWILRLETIIDIRLNFNLVVMTEDLKHLFY